jgi:HEXXH motif-containing protein
MSGSDSALFAFRPDAQRGRAVDARVRAGLADSISAVLQALAGKGVSSEDDVVAHVRVRPVAPVVFGVYTELVEAVFADDIDLAVRVAGELATLALAPVPGLRIVTLNDYDLGEGQSARYRRLLDDDPEVGRSLRPLTPAGFTRASGQVGDALALLDAAAPELADEIRTLVKEIVLVETDDEDFGASSFQLWGALFLKVRPRSDRVEIAEAMAHEGAHALLFGLGMGKPLVRNGTEIRYSSPLREDPRPMDGVVHATYVLGRMHYAVSRLLESGLLTEEEAAGALAARKRSARHHADSWSVIDPAVQWTPAGEAALAAARAYMAEQG